MFPQAADFYNYLALKAKNLREHKLTRQSIPALYEPEFTDPATASYNLSESDLVIAVTGDNEVRVYPYSLMSYHEIVNDKMDGKAYMVCYCLLADFAAVYQNSVCGQELNFAASGYTYWYQDPMQRDTATQALCFGTGKQKASFFR